MALLCLLFSSDQGTAEPIRRVLSDLGIEGEYCASAVEAVEKVTKQPLHIVIIDWDNQPEAALLLNAARQRKASERPLTLAIVSSDASVPQALQAGANSILRKPIQINQVRDTLTTARDLLRSKVPASPPVTVASGSGAAAAPALATDPAEKTLRAGEFLQPTTAPSAQFDTELNAQESLEQAVVSEVDPLKDLEPMAASVAATAEPSAPPAHHSDEPRGLAWYLNARAGTLPAAEPAAAAARTELLGYETAASSSPNAPASAHHQPAPIRTDSPEHTIGEAREKKAEAALFAYISGESPRDPEINSRPPWLGKAVLTSAVVLACGVAYVTVPRSLWRQSVKPLIGRVANVGHNWLNPPTVAPQQAPTSHENFGRAGDEYKLPVAENIPDATTDPSQIRVIPVIDPTAKQPNNASTNTGQAPATSSPDGSAPGDQPSTATSQAPDNQTPQPAPTTIQTTGDQPGAVAASPPASNIPAETAHADNPPAPAVVQPTAPVQPPPQRTTQPRPISVVPTSTIPSSLRSQMATSTPEASGNKPVEAAMASIEPVVLPEAAARTLLLEGPTPAYPSTAKGQQGTVVLQVLIGRDGTVQDAKFMQGSLAFARTAIDGVKQWKFKPYTMNNRAVSVQTLLSIGFKPGS